MADDAPTSPRPADAGENPTAADKVDDAPSSENLASANSITADDAKAVDREKTAGDASVAKKGDDDAPAGSAAEPEKSSGNATGDVDKKESESEKAPDGEVASDDKAAPAAAATPVSSKKKTTTPKVSKKKSTANLKGTKTPSKKEDVKFEPGNHVMAKMRSYPPWPAIVLNDETLPPELQKNRPQPKKDGSVTAYNTTYPIMFMGTYEYSWMSVTDLDLLTEEARKAGPPAKKKKGLQEAYDNAAEGFSLEDVKELLEATPMDVDEIEEAEDEEMEEEEEEEAESEDAKPKKKQGKKRKKSEAASEDDAESEKPAKTPKKAAASKAKTPKSTAKTPKTPANGTKSASKPKASATKEKKTPKSEKKATPAKKTKGSAKSKDVVVESESEGEAESEKEESEEKAPPDPSTMTPEERRKLMLLHRHSLQKAFLNKEQKMPEDSEIPELEKHLKSLEDWPNLEADLILATKIHKVLKGIIKLTGIPREGEFQFKERSSKLLDRWNTILNAHAKVVEKKENGVTEKTNGHKESTPEKKVDPKSTEPEKTGEDIVMADGAENDNTDAPAIIEKTEEVKVTSDKENTTVEAKTTSEVTVL